MGFISSRIHLFTMKRTVITLLGLNLALSGIAQLPAYDTGVYTFLRSATTDSIILGQQQMYKTQTVWLSGTVSDQNDRALQGAIAVLGNKQYSTVTDAAGHFAFQLPHEALSTYNVVSVSAPGKKTAVQTLHWTALPATVNFQLQPLPSCGCPPDSIKTRCCDINISMSIDRLFEKEVKAVIQKRLSKGKQHLRIRKQKR